MAWQSQMGKRANDMMKLEMQKFPRAIVMSPKVNKFPMVYYLPIF
jgi:hypothetical protein